MSEKRRAPDKPDAKTERERRLAEALRLNLKRRKAAAKTQPAAKQSSK